MFEMIRLCKLVGFGVFVGVLMFLCVVSCDSENNLFCYVLLIYVGVLGYENNDDVCEDLFDNDQDGFIDCVDFDCIYDLSYCGEFVLRILFW